jgi:hypothetical protein
VRGERRHVCAACFARQVHLDACARCGGALLDLRVPGDRAAVAERIAAEARHRAARTRQSGRELQVIVMGAVIGGGGLLLSMASGLGDLWFALAMLAGLVVMPLLLWAVTHRIADEPDGAVLRSVTPRLESVDRVRAEAGAPPRARARATGRVRVTRPVEAPVSGRPCAAARVTGMAFGVVDDAVCGAFELLDAQGAVVARYDGAGVAVDVSVGDATVSEGAGDALRAFLDERMVYQDGARVSLGEAVIVDGDLVTLEGPADDAVVAAGYRETRAVKAFAGTGAWPVVLRRDEEPTPRVRVDVTAEGAEAVGAEEAVRRRGREATGG